MGSGFSLLLSGFIITLITQTFEDSLFLVLGGPVLFLVGFGMYKNERVGAFFLGLFSMSILTNSIEILILANSPDTFLLILKLVFGVAWGGFMSIKEPDFKLGF